MAKKRNKIVDKRDAIIDRLIVGFLKDSQILTVTGDDWRVTDLAGNLLAAGGDVIDLAKRSGIE